MSDTPVSEDSGVEVNKPEDRFDEFDTQVIIRVRKSLGEAEDDIDDNDYQSDIDDSDSDYRPPTKSTQTTRQMSRYTFF
jgi:hypothetical protein